MAVQLPESNGDLERWSSCRPQRPGPRSRWECGEPEGTTLRWLPTGGRSEREDAHAHVETAADCRKIVERLTSDFYQLSANGRKRASDAQPSTSFGRTDTRYGDNIIFHGSAAPMRTPTGCCAHTYPRALTL